MVTEVICLLLVLALLWWLRRDSLQKRVDRLPRGFEPCGAERKAFTSQYSLLEKAEDIADALKHFESCAYLGVDIEQFQPKGSPGFICLIQISDGLATFLLDPIKLGKRNIQRLHSVLTSNSVLKIMHGCSNDLRWLQRDFGLRVINLYDTQVAARLLGLSALSLNNLWEKYCDYIMTKEEKRSMQMSDWSQRPLPKDMAAYAALDAYYLPYIQSVTCSLLTAQQRESLRTECNSLCLERFDLTPARDKTTEKLYRDLCLLRDKEAGDIPAETFAPASLLQQISQSKPTESALKTLISAYPFANCLPQILLLIQKATNRATRFEKKQQRFDEFSARFTVKHNIYENCQMQAPDGDVLCFCDKKKTQWYLDRGLADEISADPVIIRLKFEPNGRGFSDVYADPDFYMKFKENQCVVCGAKKHFLRYHVVPVLYRQHFPEKFKSHRSHDVVILCAKCHEQANKTSDVLKKTIAEEYQVPLNEFGDKHHQKEEVIRMGKLCQSLKRHRSSMPSDRKAMMDQQVMDFLSENEEYREFLAEKGYDVTQVTEPLLAYLSVKSTDLLAVHGSVNWKKESVNRHGLEVLRQVPDLKEFIKRWRIHFISTMNPQFLPDAWSVDHALNLKIS
jgi:hypothetical protein